MSLTNRRIEWTASSQTPGIQRPKLNWLGTKLDESLTINVLNFVGALDRQPSPNTVTQLELDLKLLGLLRDIMLPPNNIIMSDFGRALATQKKHMYHQLGLGLRVQTGPVGIPESKTVLTVHRLKRPGSSERRVSRIIISPL